MIIGSQYKDNSIFRAIKHYDGLPLTSGDLHETSDTLYSKSSHLFSNLLGSGIINELKISTNSKGIYISDYQPIVLLLDGDVILIAPSNPSSDPLVRKEDIVSAYNSGISDGVFCLVGWYQQIDANTTMRAYGGVNNSEIHNYLKDDLNYEVSRRVQFRWDTVILSKEALGREYIPVSIKERDANGDIVTGGFSSSISFSASDTMKGDIVRKQYKFGHLVDIAESDVFFLPLVYYSYNGNAIGDLRTIKPIKAGGSVTLAKDSKAPTEDIEESLIWYNTNTDRFSMYIEDKGFVPLAPSINLSTKMNTVILAKKETNPTINIGIDYSDTDVLRVVYEGLVLIPQINYTVSADKSSVTLIDFTTNSGERISFEVISVESSSTDSPSSSSSNLIIF